MKINTQKFHPSKRKGISALGLDLTSFPLVVMFFATMLVLGQTASSYQTDNPFGLSNIFTNGVAPFGNNIPNLNNVTQASGFNLQPQQQTAGNSACTPFSPINLLSLWGIFITLSSVPCYVITNASTVVSSLFFNVVINSATPQNIQVGYLTIIFFLMSTILITGISVLGTGLNTASIFLLFQMGGYTLLWLLLSTTSFPVFNGTSNSIPQPFGNLFFLILTGMYTFGVFRRVT